MYSKADHQYDRVFDLQHICLWAWLSTDSRNSYWYKINFRERWRGNQKWTIQRNWQHTENAIVKRSRTDNTIVKRSRTDNTIVKRSRTDKTIAKRSRWYHVFIGNSIIPKAAKKLVCTDYSEQYVRIVEHGPDKKYRCCVPFPATSKKILFFPTKCTLKLIIKISNKNMIS
jgi:hypothetical protein